MNMLKRLVGVFETKLDGNRIVWEIEQGTEMKLMNASTAFTVAVLMLSTTITCTDAQSDQSPNWPQWRGPNANGSSKHGKPPLKWSEKQNVQWKLELDGEGTSTPIVWNDRVIYTTAIKTDRVSETPPEKHPEAMTRPPTNLYQFMVWCVSLKDGKEIWKSNPITAVPVEGKHKTHTYAAASPVTDGKHIYVSFGSMGIVCLEFETGKLKWNVDLGDMQTRRGWGEAVSPVLSDNRLIVMWDQEVDSKMFVLNTEDGKVLWKRNRDEPTTWATPLVVEHSGKTQVITNGTNSVRSYDLELGEIIWETTGTTLNAISCPIQFGSNVICMAGYRGNRAFSIGLDSKGEVAAKETKWEINRGTPYVPSPTISENRLYFTKGMSAILNCVNAESGKEFYSAVRIEGLKNLYASPVAVNGRVYIPSREGATAVVKDADEYELLAVNKLDDSIDASPVVAGDRLLLRGHRNLYCIGESK